MGTIPQGWAVYGAGTPDDPYRMEPILGGPEDTSSAEAAAAEQTARAGNIVIEDIGRLRDRIENAPWYSPATGAIGAIMRNVPGTGAFDAQALQQTIAANIGFDRLQQMREASPTGGALGAVSERELDTLQSVLGNISLSQSEDQLLENLGRLERVYKGILEKAAAYPNAGEFGFTPLLSRPDDVPQRVWDAATEEEKRMLAQ